MHEITKYALLATISVTAIFGFLTVVAPLVPVCPVGSTRDGRDCVLTTKPLGYERVDDTPQIVMTAFCWVVTIAAAAIDFYRTRRAPPAAVHKALNTADDFFASGVKTPLIN